MGRLGAFVIATSPGDMPEGTLRAILEHLGVEPDVFLQKK